jgi:hypothetical protein
MWLVVKNIDTKQPMGACLSKYFDVWVCALHCQTNNQQWEECTLFFFFYEQRGFA